MAEAREDQPRVVDRAVIGTLLDHRHAERPLAAPCVGVVHERIGADRLADARLVERGVVDRPDHAVGVAVGRQIDRRAAREQQRAVVGRLVVVAVEQHEVSRRHQRPEHDLVGGRGAVQHEIGALGAEDPGGGLLGGQRRALVRQQVAHLDHRVVDVVAEDRGAEVFHEDAADRAAVVEDAAIVAGTGPELVALLGVVDQRPEERRLEGGRVVAQAADQVAGDELRRLLGQEDGAVGVVEHLDRDVLEPLAAQQDQDRHLQPSPADQRDQAGGLAEHAALAPVHHHAADRGIGADREFGVLGAAGDEHGEAEAPGLGHDLLQPQPVEVAVVERGRADQELEAALVFHGRPRTLRRARYSNPRAASAAAALPEFGDVLDGGGGRDAGEVGVDVLHVGVAHHL